LRAMNDCIFCRIANGSIPNDKVLENDRFLAFRDIHPMAPVHVLVIPRQHLASLNDVGEWRECEGQQLLEFIVQVAEATGIAETGYRVVSNVGPDAGQEVQHMHLHVLGGENLGDFR
jgi:histidine triad (HIT) family protein